MSYNAPVKFTVTGKYGNVPDGEDDVYTLEEFKDFCDSGAFIDYDGYGNPVKDNKADTKIILQPSYWESVIPKDATHIIWYNR